jgi:F-type H+-transporting ATPase subunit a
VNQFCKFILASAFFVAIFATNLSAQPSNAANAVGSDETTAVSGKAAAVESAKEAGEGVPAAAPEVFCLLGLPVTNSMICTWIVAAIILIIVRVGTWHNIKEIPSGLQNLIEALVEAWDGLIGDILDKRVTRWVFPFATTYFIFIVMSNFTDLMPGVGSIGFGKPDPHSSLPFAIGEMSRPFFRPPTTDANLTVAMAGIFLVMSLYWAVRFNGFWGLFKHIFGVKMETSKFAYPLFFLLFLFIGAMELLSVGFARPVALAMRLYGNIFAGETILHMTFQNQFIISFFLTTFVYFYETFVCLVQAFVFAMLVVAFVGTLCTATEEGHGH